MSRAALLLLACIACDDGGDAARDLGTRVDGAADLGRPDGPPADARVVDASPPDAAPADGAVDGAIADAGAGEVAVVVTLDGEPTAGILVVQGGTDRQARTDAQGRVDFPIDDEVIGQVALIASHPEARIKAVEIYAEETGVRRIDLVRFGPDNPDYLFQDPGEPDRRNSTGQCGHCHLTMNDDWFASVHRTAARNPVVHDLYAGVVSGVNSAECVERGGRVARGRVPGGGTADRCYLGVGALPALNPECADGPCPEPADTGHCADCHAPGINGQLGGRDLLDAEDFAYRFGVSCDICHRVEAVDPEGGPGVSGRLRLHRPSESAPISLGPNLPLTFGPSHDSPNPRMGSVQREHFHDGSLCSGCHELTQPTADRARWPDGVFPVQSTYDEWKTGALSEATRCNSCHMPPNPRASNGGDLQAFPLADIGIQGGWIRPPGAVRRHTWVGPRNAESQMLELAAALFVDKARVDGGWDVEITTRNVGAGHAIPTGEPMRQLLLTVDATCEGAPLAATGGDVVPAFVGAVEVRQRGQDWTRWGSAQVGDRIRVVRRTDGFYDYPAYGRMDALSAADKGLPVGVFVGESVVIELHDPLVIDPPLPDGDFAYLVRGDAPAAGQPGFAFARVLVDAEGREMVPHFVATTMASDNRLMPQARWTSRHRFADCAEPLVRARLWYRRYPSWLATERAWDNADRMIVEVVR